jgi:hypothetical protein
VPGRDTAVLERVQDGVAVDAILAGKIVHAPASLVLLANLRDLDGREAPLMATPAPGLPTIASAVPTMSCSVWSRRLASAVALSERVSVRTTPATPRQPYSNHQVPATSLPVDPCGRSLQSGSSELSMVHGLR